MVWSKVSVFVSGRRKLHPIFSSNVIIPTKVGIHCSASAAVEAWIPTFVGMTNKG
jgi:hypothetical protein